MTEQDLIKQKDQAYWERNQLVILLSKIFPSHLCKHDEKDLNWEKDWRWIVCVHTPHGQCAWHIHDSERHYFVHLPIKTNHWDGHTTEQKYDRLRSFDARNMKIVPPKDVQVKCLDCGKMCKLIDGMFRCVDCGPKSKKLIIPRYTNAKTEVDNLIAELEEKKE